MMRWLAIPDKGQWYLVLRDEDGIDDHTHPIPFERERDAVRAAERLNVIREKSVE
jgi:hypothetical protein